ncbi:2,3-bisphosphoglycerate-independent phosphoglycerate mutase [Maritimibacter sp. UBA3975]|uniref:2,3-bisphosphoglycerate-independent phosphoglycerate mutase n=1 Tax=Maritimibacter sp. UBA3975 TaxID=1946833 RepID=UPI000C0A1A98|nr:2,3-bisphosphoglycerate-independent phosphoglycerate mutase [Maritimibacter sp. UBA3975]MAM63344.1 phosphoglycerate mutase (2,3-diphosphoglycerate-independent) [Maritimibacter sp.]|tara:strand:+ start:3236 stop:4756 length:1521 start_codon:yes stop_codon:yes gene_type:complete
MTTPKPIVLCILDGWGLRVESAGNAVAQAETPAFDELMMICPNATLVTHGNDAGLPAGQMGNSEVGHTNIGAGRVVAMDLGQIDLAIEDRSFFQNAALMAFIDDMKGSGGTAHLVGLTSPGGVHAHQDHIVAAAQALRQAGLPVCVHVITDGRDVAPKSAREQVARFVDNLPEGVQVASVSGRYFAMDRDNRWERVSRAYDAVVKGMGETADSADAAIAAGYDRGETDEFIQPTVIEGHTGIHDGDGVFFVNFRADRAREILRAIGEPGFAEFDAGARPKLAALLGMVEYSKAHNDYMTTVFPSEDIVNTLGAWVAQQGKRQFRLAETEKYPHVTFFLNGGKEDPEEGEVRYMAQSPKVATYDLQPEMSAPEVGRELVKAIHEKYDLIVVNFANPDMVGHTGDLEAAIAAVEAVDEQVIEAMIALKQEGGAMIVTADHGNCEMMIDPETGGPHTAHTTNPVPVALFNGPEGATIRSGRLADLAPSLLDLMEIEKPAEMTGESLIVR